MSVSLSWPPLPESRRGVTSMDALAEGSLLGRDGQISKQASAEDGDLFEHEVGKWVCLMMSR